jgi:hypothetical protein
MYTRKNTNSVMAVLIIASLATGFVLLSINSLNYIQLTNAQSQSANPQVGQVFTFNEKSRPANAPQQCADLASVVKGKAVPDFNLCDIIVYRQAPPIVRNDGMVLNNYSGFGHYIEMVPAVINSTGVFGANGVSINNASSTPSPKDNLTAAFGEWALIDSEVVPVQKVMQKYNWTQTALHSHMLGELPKVLFLHWAVTGNPNELIKQAKEIMMQTTTYNNLTGETRTPSSAGP